MAAETAVSIIINAIDKTKNGFAMPIKSLGDLDKAITKIAPAFSMVAGAAATAFAAMAAHSINAADALGKTSEACGVSTEQLSTLGYAAKLGGADTSTFNTAIRELNKSMVEAASGNEKTKAQFDALGISVRNTDGSIKKADQVLYEMSDAFAVAKDGAAKSRVAIELMGKAGDAMIPTLNAGSAALRESQQEARAFGLEVSGNSAKAAAEFNDNITRLKDAVYGVAQSVAMEFLPTLVSWTKATVQAVKENGIMSATVWTVVDAFTACGRAIGAIWDLLKVVVGNWVAQIFIFKEGLEGMVDGVSAGMAALAGDLAGAKQHAANASAHFIEAARMTEAGWKEAAKGVRQIFEDLSKPLPSMAPKSAAAAAPGSNKADGGKRDIVVVDLAAMEKQKALYEKTMEEIGKAYAKAADSQYQQIVREYEREAKIISDYYDKQREVVAKSVATVEEKAKRVAEIDAKEKSDLLKAEQVKNQKVEDLTKKTLESVQKEYLSATGDRIALMDLEYEKKREQLTKELAGSKELKAALDKLEKAHTITVEEELRRRQVAYEDAKNRIRLSGLTGLNAQIAGENQSYADEQRDIVANKDYTPEQRQTLLNESTNSHQNRVDKMGTDLGRQMSVEGYDTSNAYGAMEQRLASIEVEKEAEVELYNDRLAMIDNLAIAQDKRNALRQQAEKVHQQKLINLDKQAARTKQDTMLSYAQAANQVLGNMAAFAASQGKKGFAVAKGIQYAQTVINTASAAMGAYNAMASIPYVGPALGIAAAAAAIAAGSVQLGNIASAQYQGQAHDGMTYIQQPGSWYLDGGERVVASNQNADLMQFMQEFRAGGGGPREIVLNLEGKPILRLVAAGIRDGRLDIQAGRAL